jgi:hypothetical protein
MYATRKKPAAAAVDTAGLSRAGKILPATGKSYKRSPEMTGLCGRVAAPHGQTKKLPRSQPDSCHARWHAYCKMHQKAAKA